MSGGREFSGSGMYDGSLMDAVGGAVERARSDRRGQNRRLLALSIEAAITGWLAEDLSPCRYGAVEYDAECPWHMGEVDWPELAERITDRLDPRVTTSRPEKVAALVEWALARSESAGDDELIAAAVEAMDLTVGQAIDLDRRSAGTKEP